MRKVYEENQAHCSGDRHNCLMSRKDTIDGIPGCELNDRGAFRVTNQPVIDANGAIVGRTEVLVQMTPDEQLKVIADHNDAAAYVEAWAGGGGSTVSGGGGTGGEWSIILVPFYLLAELGKLAFKNPVLSLVIVAGLLVCCGTWQLGSAVSGAISNLTLQSGQEKVLAKATTTRDNLMVTPSPTRINTRVSPTVTSTTIPTVTLASGALFCLSELPESGVAAVKTLEAGARKKLPERDKAIVKKVVEEQKSIPCTLVK